jgi:hypothetical protein
MDRIIANGGLQKMGSDPHTLLTELFIERLSSLEIQGEVTDKRVRESISKGVSEKFLVIRFKDREFEKPVRDTEFEQIKIGESFRFTPPIPECDPCHGHFLVCMALVFAACAFAIWAITTYFSSRTALLVSLVAAGWIAIIAWAWICSHEKNKFSRKLEEELQFFEYEQYDHRGT